MDRGGAGCPAALLSTIVVCRRIKKSAPEFTFALCINCVLSIVYNAESFYLYAMGKSTGKAIIDKAKGRNVEGFRFASEFPRGDRIIMRPQWRWSARWKDDVRHYPAASLNSLMITR